MSLLDTGTQTVIIYPEVAVEDSYGNRMKVPSKNGTEALASVQPMSNIASSESAELGQMLNTRYRVRVDRRSTVPYGPWSAIEWRGDVYEVLGEPEIHTGSSNTQHVVAFIRRQ